MLWATLDGKKLARSWQVTGLWGHWCGYVRLDLDQFKVCLLACVSFGDFWPGMACGDLVRPSIAFADLGWPSVTLCDLRAIGMWCFTFNWWRACLGAPITLPNSFEWQIVIRGLKLHTDVTKYLGGKAESENLIVCITYILYHTNHNCIMIMIVSINKCNAWCPH